MKNENVNLVKELKQWGNFTDDSTLYSEIERVFDNVALSLLDSNGYFRSCYLCPFSIWYRDYKRCPILKQNLHIKWGWYINFKLEQR